jgi:hypothetical protein
MNEHILRLLEERTGQGLEAWNKRVAASGAEDEAALGRWLEAEGVTGCPKQVLLMERFGIRISSQQLPTSSSTASTRIGRILSRFVTPSWWR